MSGREGRRAKDINWNYILQIVYTSDFVYFRPDSYRDMTST